MKAIKLTPWFKANVKPVRPGLYQTKMFCRDGSLDEQKFSYWNGSRWSDSAMTREGAIRSAGVVGYQKKKWRGLAEQPK